MVGLYTCHAYCLQSHRGAFKNPGPCGHTCGWCTKFCVVNWIWHFRCFIIYLSKRLQGFVHHCVTQLLYPSDRHRWCLALSPELGYIAGAYVSDSFNICDHVDVAPTLRILLSQLLRDGVWHSLGVFSSCLNLWQSSNFKSAPGLSLPNTAKVPPQHLNTLHSDCIRRCHIFFGTSAHA